MSQQLPYNPNDVVRLKLHPEIIGTIYSCDFIEAKVYWPFSGMRACPTHLECIESVPTNEMPKLEAGDRYTNTRSDTGVKTKYLCSNDSSIRLPRLLTNMTMIERIGTNGWEVIWERAT